MVCTRVWLGARAERAVPGVRSVRRLARWGAGEGWVRRLAWWGAGDCRVRWYACGRRGGWCGGVRASVGCSGRHTVGAAAGVAGRGGVLGAASVVVGCGGVSAAVVGVWWGAGEWWVQWRACRRFVGRRGVGRPRSPRAAGRTGGRNGQTAAPGPLPAGAALAAARDVLRESSSGAGRCGAWRDGGGGPPVGWRGSVRPAVRGGNGAPVVRSQLWTAAGPRWRRRAVSGGGGSRRRRRRPRAVAPRRGRRSVGAAAMAAVTDAVAGSSTARGRRSPQGPLGAAAAVHRSAVKRRIGGRAAGGRTCALLLSLAGGKASASWATALWRQATLSARNCVNK